MKQQENLLTLARQGDSEAMSAVVAQYKGLIRSVANNFYLVGGDKDDLLQEGMLGLFNAVNNYKRIQSDINREQSFADLNRKWGYLNYLCRDLANAKEIRFHYLSGWLSKKISGFVQDHQSIIRDSFLQTATASRRSG